MLKAGDLRVGNYIMGDAKIPFQIELSDFADWYNDHNSHEYGNHLYPIPLTAEWLEKFGFYGKYKSVHSHWSKGGVGIEQASDQDDDGYTIHPAPQEFFYQWNFNIPFVHTLQNLYHSLTGEELTINL